MRKFFITVCMTIGALAVGCGVSSDEYDQLKSQLQSLHVRTEELQSSVDGKMRKSVEAAESKLSASLDEVRARQAELKATLDSIQANFSNVLRSGMSAKGTTSAEMQKVSNDLNQLQRRLSHLEKVIITGDGIPGGGR